MYENTTASARPPQQSERDRGQIDRHLERMCQAAEEAGQLQAEIEIRLSPICRPTPPVLGAEGGKPAEVLVPIADVLSRKADLLEYLVRAQRDFLARIEL